MKLFTSVGPNPQVVRVFIAEKDIPVEMVKVDLMGGENRQPEYLLKNPSGQCPCLATDSGMYISEITAICEYLEDVHPEPPLIGTTPEEKAETRMWTRRIDLNICERLGDGYRWGEGVSFFKERIPVAPEASDGLKRIAQQRLTWLDELIEGKPYICGDRFTLADILLYCMMRFFAKVGQPINDENKNIGEWYARVGERPSMKA